MNEAEVELGDEALKEILEELGVSSVFGKPVKQGEITIIPVAETRIGFGYGSGKGKGRQAMGSRKRVEGDEDEGDVVGEGTGRGYGGGGKVVPVGFIKITPDEVMYQPVFNVMRMAMAGVALVAWAIYRITRVLEPAEE